MKGSIHRFACVALVLIALALTGCEEWRTLKVRIPNFEGNLIQGVELWRAEDKGSEIWTAAGRIVFGDYISGNGWEDIEFTMVDSRNRPIQGTSRASVVRVEEDDSVTFYFTFVTWSQPLGWTRVSSFNAVGDSELSDEAAFLGL